MQNANQSVLFLFDPLCDSSTPERHASSPDPSSDKENDTPPGQVTAFFNRVYKHNTPYNTRTPKGKLIDYDFTVMARQSEDEEDDMAECDNGGMILDGLDAASDAENRLSGGDEEMENGEENAEEDTIQIPSTRRQPLADIHLESVLGFVPDPDPIPVEGSPDSSMWDEADTIMPSVTAAPANAPLANIINAINFAGLSIHSADPSDEQDSVGHAVAPAITVVPPEYSHTSPVACTPQRLFASHLAPSPSISSTATRRLAPTTSAADPRRTSVDLQSSFRLQLQNADMSFDLLNDKISFLGHDSFWAGTGDESIDFKKEEEAMMAIAEECESSQAIPPLATSTESSTFSPPGRSRPSLERRQSLSVVPAASTEDMQPLRQEARPQTTAPAVHSPPPAPVPALRIFKKSRKIHDSGESTISTLLPSAPSSTVCQSHIDAFVDTANETSAGRVPAKRSAPTPREEKRAGEPPVPEMQKARVVVKGLQRPPPGAVPPPMTSLGLPKMRATSATSIAKKLGVSRPSAGTGNMGPPALPLQRPALVTSKVPSSTLGVTSRLAGLGSTLRTTSGIPGSSSGPFRPVRSAAGAGSSTAPTRSGLPVPQSKIPGAPRTGVASRLPTAAAPTRRFL
ncbi:hypothetical protein BXZ70DRAFT_950847 [Cristinia sonorae]|uniref:Uncharacterized protein n=1 Tax=Cristinia sonorae TaxID=1940300 RepID=A0A8K0XM77_9AGAR|nr:hypothetical protein BXZ70DRAFT_950847 [Cristinia sonorae]